MSQRKCSAVSTIRGAVGLAPKVELTPRHMSRVLTFTQDQVQLYWAPSITSIWSTQPNEQSTGWIYRNRARDGGLLLLDYLPKNRNHNLWGGEIVVSQKISYKDSKLQVWVSTDGVNRNTLGLQREGKRTGWKRRKEREKKMVSSWSGMRKTKKEGVALQSSCHLQMPRCYGNFLLGFQERTGTQPYQKPEIRPEPEFKFSANWRWSSCDPQLRLRPFNQTPESSTGGEEKKSRIGGVEKRDERKRKKRKGQGSQ